MISPRSFFVFDVESIGLHGEGFAVAGGIYFPTGESKDEFCFCCESFSAMGSNENRKWVNENVPSMVITNDDPEGVRYAFWEQWKKAKESGSEMAAECLWPVEAKFLEDCIGDDIERLKTAPYPVYDVSAVMLASGMNPMATYERTPNELPAHNPLADARQSARLLFQALNKTP